MTGQREALRLAHQYESAARKKLTKKKARQILADIYESLNGQPLPAESIEDFIKRWKSEQKDKVAPGTYRKYADECSRFIAHLGDKAKSDMDTINRADITSFQASVAKSLSVGTANTALKILRVLLNEAVRQHLIDENPATEVKTISRRNEESIRRPFTLDEIRLLLKLADKEWHGVILWGYYSGQRLQDIVTATWRSVDQKTKSWTFVTKKTHRKMTLPLAAPLLKYLNSLKRKPGQIWIFPKLASSVQRTGRVGEASNQFHELLVRAKLLSPRTKQGTGKGRSSKRQQNELSFHCLRHTANSLLKKAGNPDSVVMAFVGHDSDATSKKYTHIETASLIKALRSLPQLS